METFFGKRLPFKHKLCYNDSKFLRGGSMRKAIRLLAALLALLLLFSGCSFSLAEESKNGEAAMRPNIIENYELKVFLQEQDDRAKENLFALALMLTA